LFTRGKAVKYSRRGPVADDNGKSLGRGAFIVAAMIRAAREQAR
jgi:hypothetical protein